MATVDTIEAGQFGPRYNLDSAGLRKWRKLASHGKRLSKEQRQAYGDAVHAAVQSAQRQALRRAGNPSHPCQCASGTWHNTGEAIHNAIRAQHRADLLAYPEKARRNRTPEQWKEMYEAAMQEKKARASQPVTVTAPLPVPVPAPVIVLTPVTPTPAVPVKAVIVPTAKPAKPRKPKATAKIIEFPTKPHKRRNGDPEMLYRILDRLMASHELSAILEALSEICSEDASGLEDDAKAAAALAADAKTLAAVAKRIKSDDALAA